MPEMKSKLEIDRIENLISNFGWKITKQEIKEDEIVLRISKTIYATAVEIAAGAS